MAWGNSYDALGSKPLYMLPVKAAWPLAQNRQSSGISSALDVSCQGHFVNQDPCHYNWIDYYRLPARHANLKVRIKLDEKEAGKLTWRTGYTEKWQIGISRRRSDYRYRFFNIPFPGRSIIFNIRLFSGRFRPDSVIFFRQTVGWRIYFQDLNSIDSVLSFSNSKVQKTFE